MAAIVRPRFYAHIALVLAALIFIAFSRTYYLRFLSDLPPLTQLVHLHGLVSTAWIALFVAQTRLVAAHRVDLHMKLGLVGVLLAVAMIVVGVLTVAAAAAGPGTRPSGLTQPQFSAIPMMSTLLFAIFLSLALWLRRRSDFHKRLMVLAVIAIIGPAVGRLIAWGDLRMLAPIIQPGVVLALVAWCLVFDWRRHHLVHPVFAYGGLALLLSWPFRQWLARSEFYAPVADWFARTGAALIG
jgi:hypothetical protein